MSTYLSSEMTLLVNKYNVHAHAMIEGKLQEYQINAMKYMYTRFNVQNTSIVVLLTK